MAENSRTKTQSPYSHTGTDAPRPIDLAPA
jgi:hypothetical protein